MYINKPSVPASEKPLQRSSVSVSPRGEKNPWLGCNLCGFQGFFPPLFPVCVCVCLWVFLVRGSVAV